MTRTDDDHEHTDRVELFPIAIGRFRDPAWPSLDGDAEVGRVLEVLADCGVVQVRWPGLSHARDASAVESRLRDWARPARPANSVLYWIGHGWSDGLRAALAHADSPLAVRTFGITPTQVADPVRSRQATSYDRWAIVIIDACQSAMFAQRVNAELDFGRLYDGTRVLLLGVSGEGATTLGRFSRALERSLRGTFMANTRIRLDELGADLQRQLPGSFLAARDVQDAHLTRLAAPAASLSGPLDTIRYLEEVLSELPVTERRHFIAKAQAAEEGEVSWFFEGRARELALIATWLRRAARGLLIVTGRAGAGKSALLGQVLVQSLPDLAKALVRRGLITRLPDSSTPAPHVFDGVLHLSGLGINDVVLAVAEAAGLSPLPSKRDPSLGLANDLDWLTAGLRARRTPLTLLMDALDESTDPLTIARSVLCRIAAEPGVRLVLGTRSSTRETPDEPAPDAELLRVLRAPHANSPVSGSPEHALEPAPEDTAEVIVVGQDPEAVRRYVIRRLTEARDHPSRRFPLAAAKPSDERIGAAADAIGRAAREFLFAQLAVHELLHDPNLMNVGRARSLTRLVSATHGELFGLAIKRLGDLDDRYPHLLAALAHARGRGLPIADDIWVTVADAAFGTAEQHVTREAVAGLLAQNPAYITVDSDSTQTVYRLSHRTFVEHFSRHDAFADSATRVARALLVAATSTRSEFSAYLRRYLSGHIADAGLWDELADNPSLLDDLDPDRVTADAVRTLFGRAGVPAPVAGVISARPELVTASRADRAGLRQLSTIRHLSRRSWQETPDPWGVSAASVRSQSIHLRLTGHDGSVNALCALTYADGRRLIASGGDDGTVRLWDPISASPVGDSMIGHRGTVEALCTVRGHNGRTLLASGGGDGSVRLWDPLTTGPASLPLIGHRGPVFGICEVRADGRTLLATSGDDGSVRVWDPLSGEAVQTMNGHVGAVFGLCPVVVRGRAAIVSVGQDSTIRLWDPVSGASLADPLRGHMGTVWGVTARRRGGGAQILTTGYDGTLRRWDISTGESLGPVIDVGAGRVWGVCEFEAADGRTLIATTADDGGVRLWDEDANSTGPALTGHVGIAWRVCSLADSGAGLLATAGVDGTVRMWDAAAPAAFEPPAESARLFTVRTASTRDGRRLLVSCGDDGQVRQWDPVTGRPVAASAIVREPPAYALSVLPQPPGPDVVIVGGLDGGLSGWDVGEALRERFFIPGPRAAAYGSCLVRPAGRAGDTMLATSSNDGAVRIWNPGQQILVGQPMTGHRGIAYALCAFARSVLQGARARQHGDTSGDETDGEVLASAGQDGTLRIWDPLTHQQVGPVMRGHVGSVYGVCTVRRMDRVLLVSSGQDGTLRRWDPATGVEIEAAVAVPSGGVYGLCAISRPDGDLVAGGCEDGTVRVWDPWEQREVCPPLTGHIGRVRDVCAVAGPGADPLVASVGADGRVLIHDITRGTGVGLAMGGRTGCVDQILSWDGGSAIAVTSDGTIQMWNDQVADSRLLRSDPPITTVSIVDEGRHGRLLLCAETDGMLLVDPQDGSIVHTTRRDARAAAVSLTVLPPEHPSGEVTTAAAGCRDGSIVMWHIRRGEPLFTASAPHEAPVQALCAVRTDRGIVLVSGDHAGALGFWSVSGGELELVGSCLHGSWVWSLTVVRAADQTPLVVSAHADGSLQACHAISATPVAPAWRAHTDQARALVTLRSTSGEELLASGGLDGTVRLWNARTFQSVQVIPLGLPVLTLAARRHDERSLVRTHGGALLTVGTAEGIVVLDLHAKLFASPT